jgi:hypothetical protein
MTNAAFDHSNFSVDRPPPPGHRQGKALLGEVAH